MLEGWKVKTFQPSNLPTPLVVSSNPPRKVQNHPRQQSMFRFEHSRRKRVGRVTRLDAHLLLRDDRAAVECFVGEVYRRARLCGTAREHRAVHALAVHPRAAEIDRKST